MSRTAIPVKAWVSAMRLRTLPLAFSCILAGSAVASLDDRFSALIFALALITTLFLQVLSNLANDLGDHLKGTDNEHRTGPMRAVQSGVIPPSSMKKAVILFAALSLFSGISLLLLAFDRSQYLEAFAFLLLGLGAIYAAVKYTIGDSPYGYRGLGDLYVFLFFGVTGVVGVSYLHQLVLTPEALLPAISIGMWSAAVLNLNNMRDHVNDANSGKTTLVVRLGFQRARTYHLLLLALGWAAAFSFAMLHLDKPLLLLTLLPLPVFLKNAGRVLRADDPATLDPELKRIALATFAYSILLFVAGVLSN